MGDIKGFMKYGRALPKKREVTERVDDYKEIYLAHSEKLTKEQSARCMDCGIPFCHSGCPLGNIIPDFNDAVYKEDWKEAYNILSSTNNFPEFTGRICPAPCEKACVLGINNDPVSIEHIEKSIVEKAYEEGWVQPDTDITRTRKTVAVVGSGPAGLAAADQLNKAGHTVTVFERNDKVGGLLQYGIPDSKLEKWVVELMNDYDAIVLAGGSTVPRDLPIPGRTLNGVHFAMEFLEQKNRQVAGQTKFDHDIITAKDKNVVIIGGGDTGADCTGTSNREKAASITQIELLTKPPLSRHESTPWPLWPMELRTSSSHEEGCDRKWALLTKEFVGDEDGNLRALKLVDIEWIFDESLNRSTFKEIDGTEREIPCELALIAVGFVHPQHTGLLEQLDVALDNRGNVQTGSDYKSNLDKVFSAGDMRRGQSLVVWAISEGRESAIEVDRFLSDGKTRLNSKSYSKLLV